MNELTYRKHLGYAMAAFFLASTLSIIITYANTWFSAFAGFDHANTVRLMAAAGMLFIIVKLLCMGYVAVRPGLCPNIVARLAAVVVLLLLVWSFVCGVYSLIYGESLISVSESSPKITRFYSLIIETLTFMAMSAFLFSQRFWIVTKLIGTFNYLLFIFTGVTYTFTVYHAFGNCDWEETQSLWTSYSMIAGAINAVSIFLCVILTGLFIFWANKRPKN